MASLPPEPTFTSTFAAYDNIPCKGRPPSDANFTTFSYALVRVDNVAKVQIVWPTRKCVMMINLNVICAKPQHCLHDPNTDAEYECTLTCVDKTGCSKDLKARAVKWQQENGCLVRVDSVDALEFWLEVRLPFV